MGFAGQVFAARVAVGLAMPSPKAFSQAGALIGGFASNMYARLNKDSVNASKRNLNTTTASLKKSREMLAQHGASQGQFLDKSATKAIQRLRGAYKGLGKSAMSSASAMKAFKGSMAKGTIKTKMFANVSKDMSKAKDYAQMMKNFTKLKKEQRNEIIAGFQADAKALAATINTSAKREKLGEDGVKLMKDEIAITKDKIKEFQHYDKARTNADSTYNKQQKKLQNNVMKGEKIQQKSKKELLAIQQKQLEMQKKITAASQKFVFEMKSNFTESLRESVSLLTAFYYKLSQNTQELISFERELLNANSVFRVTNDELFSVGDTVIQFGQEFGLSMQNGATGLYQLASAGLSASESMEVLTETLKLSMAVQGDHNTISKLVTQTLFGYDMEMSKAAEVTDKFAFAIQKSLIEYQDLSSAVKFALPFFTSTGQSIDQLLGALQILTNRALEAGIAGRGLRQGVAELAESIGDSSANFKQMGVEVVDNQGNMLQLTEIAANFSKVLGDGVINDTELLTTLIQDLNVRGATAFVHLVQSSDEFTEAVNATANAGGELDEMVKIQNESISAQIQILKNNVDMMFMYRDSAYEGTRFLNAFHESIVVTVEDMRDLLVITKDGKSELTAFGLQIQIVAVEAVEALRKEFQNMIPFLREFVSVTAAGIGILKVYLIPIKLLAGIINAMGPGLTKAVIAFYMMNKVLPITLALEAAHAAFMINKPRYVWKYIAAKEFETIAEKKSVIVAMLAAVMSFRLINAKVLLVRIMNLQAYTTLGVTGATYAEQFAMHASTLSLIKKAAITLVTIARDKIRIAVAALLLPTINANTLATKGNTYAQMNAGKAIAWKTSLMLKEYAIALKNMLMKKLEIFWETAQINLRYAYVLITGQKIRAMALESLWGEKLILIKIRDFLIDTKAFIIQKAQDIWKRTVTISGIIAESAVRFYGTLVKIGETLATQFNTTATALNTQSRLAATLAGLAGVTMLIIYTVSQYALTIGTYIMTAATWAWNASLYANPIVLIGIGIAAVVVLMVIFAIKINEQLDIWSRLKMIVGAFFGMIAYGANLFFGMFKAIYDGVYGVLEGPLFKLGLFFSHLFKMLAFYFSYVGGIVMDGFIMPIVNGLISIGTLIYEKVVEPVIGMIVGIKSRIEQLAGPFEMLGTIFMNALQPVKNLFSQIWGFLDSIVGAVEYLGSSTIGKVMEYLGYANGGYLQPMANGGQASKGGPYLVGERGPEVFMPNGPGKIVPNKDLNTQRVNNMLQRAFESGDDVDKSVGLMQSQTLQVAQLVVKEAKLGKSRIGIDSFAGGI